MAALNYNLVTTTLGADISDSATAITFTLALKEGGVNIPTLITGDFVWIKVENELMKLTAYTAGALSGTVSRGEGDTVAAFHTEGVSIDLVATKEHFGSKTFVVKVAAADASDDEINAADYVCDGVNDHVQIQAAIDEIEGRPDATGTVEFSSGTFNISAVITINGWLIFQGTGALGWDFNEGTVLTRDGVANFNMFQNTGSGIETLFRDLIIQDYGADANTSPVIETAAASSTFVFDRVKGWNYQATGYFFKISHSGTTFIATDCYLEGGTAALGATTTTLTTGKVRILDSYLFAGIDLAVGGSWDIRLEGNLIDGVVRIDGNVSNTPMPDVAVTNNVIEGRSSGAIYATDIRSLIVKGNTVPYNYAGTAFRLSNIDRGIIADNDIHGDGSSFHHGIWLLDSDYVLINNNSIMTLNSQTTDATYSGIILDGDTNNCSVTNNTIRTAGANKWLYGIRIDDSTCNDNLVEGNDLLGSCKTNGNEFSDAGTDTRGWLMVELAYIAGAVAVATNPKWKRLRRTAVLGTTFLAASTGPTGQALIVDVQKNGTKIYTTTGNRPSIIAGGTIGNSTVAPDTKYIGTTDVMAVEVMQVGSGVAGSDLVVEQRYMPI